MQLVTAASHLIIYIERRPLLINQLILGPYNNSLFQKKKKKGKKTWVHVYTHTYDGRISKFPSVTSTIGQIEVVDRHPLH